jgi:hypothetical protein
LGKSVGITNCGARIVSRSKSAMLFIDPTVPTAMPISSSATTVRRRSRSRIAMSRRSNSVEARRSSVDRSQDLSPFFPRSGVGSKSGTSAARSRRYSGLWKTRSGRKPFSRRPSAARNASAPIPIEETTLNPVMTLPAITTAPPLA